MQRPSVVEMFAVGGVMVEIAVPDPVRFTMPPVIGPIVAVLAVIAWIAFREVVEDIGALGVLEAV
jgi:hypothetical protein